MSVHIRCDFGRVDVDSSAALDDKLRSEYIGQHVTVVETLPSGTKKPHYITIKDAGDTVYTHDQLIQFDPYSINF